jgi:ABC-type polysaccharide transport system permease subunit
MFIGQRAATVQPVELEIKIGFIEEMRRHWMLYLMALPGILALLVFSYGPLFGLFIAFLDYNPVKGVLASKWVGSKNFADAFNNPFFLAALKNTVIIKGFQTIIGFPSAIILALLLNEAGRWMKRLVQTSSILPYFVSWIVIATMFHTLLTPTNGVVNEVLQKVFKFKDPVLFLSDPLIFRWVIILQDTWKFAGFFAVIYLAAMARIDPTLYEAAMVDGANRWQQTLHVTLPGIRSTIITMFILLIGYLILGSYEQIFAQYSVSTYSTVDILETFSFRMAISQNRYGFATAVSLFQSVIAFALVFLTNWLVRRVEHQGLF